ncbi:hypothetical protein RhiirA5_438670, partial [Rhizophagus irregularis]
MHTIFSYTFTSVEFDFSSLSLDRMWHALKAAILSAAIETLPFQKVSNTHRHSYSPELTKLIAINKFLDCLLYRLTTRHFNQPTQISQMITALPAHLENLASLLPDYSVPTYSRTPVTEFKSFLRSQKNLQAAITHFQTIVFPPLIHYSSIASFPVQWSDVIFSIPNNKASGPSKISYEMIKHLSSDALDFSLLLANTCLSRGDISADWRETVVYPIPKPHDFDAQLKNTRPITLLETVRKCIVKVVTNRLSNILADNKILQGGNFAGLPGGSTD